MRASTKLLIRRKLTAFEMKLADWRKGLAQACRYSYFADLAVVVLPPDLAAAKADLDLFRNSSVGLWSFDPATRTISKLFTPRRSRPRSSRAKAKPWSCWGNACTSASFANNLVHPESSCLDSWSPESFRMK